MLQKLSIQNYAIIDELHIDFSDKLTIITGETGAGKSIMLGALSLVLGERADTNVLYDKENKCIIEAQFDIKKYQLEHFFEKENIDFDTTTLLRREISVQGKSRAFINDTPVNLNVLKELSEQLVDLHIQHQTLELNDLNIQMGMLDAIAKNDSLYKDYYSTYRHYQESLNQLNKLIEEGQKLQQEQDYLQFIFNELNEANLSESEQEQLENELKKLTNAETIKKQLSDITAGLSLNEQSANILLNNLHNALKSLLKINPELEPLQTRMQASLYELQDISDELEKAEQHIIHDEERINEINERLNILYNLQRKHHVQTITELQNIQKETEQKLNRITFASEETEQLKLKVANEKKELVLLAKKLSENRQKAIPGFEKKVNTLLKEVGMPYASIKIEQKTADENEISALGIDKVEFLFTANKGMAFQNIRKVASGGELSRLMLCIKSQIADNTALPTLIFDEIDTGVSGEVAIKVGNILQQLSSSHQVICITHLPQIAGKGNTHLFVYKETDKKRTITKVRELKKEERIIEIAKMLSGEKPGEAAISTAKELLSV